MLNSWDAFWGLELELCPCDQHFVEWLEHEKISGKTIFHFGSGGHHIVGVRCAEPHLNNAVVSVTASPQEYEGWIRLAKERPELTHHYLCYFSDIYTSNARLLPLFDVVTLFHTHEFRTEKNDAYGALTDLEVMQLFTDQTLPGGRILFYTGSDGFRKAKGDLEAWEKRGQVVREGEFKTLLVYRKAG